MRSQNYIHETDKRHSLQHLLVMSLNIKTWCLISCIFMICLELFKSKQHSLMVLLLAQEMLKTEETARSEQRPSSSISEHSSALHIQEQKRGGFMSGV